MQRKMKIGDIFNFQDEKYVVLEIKSRNIWAELGLYETNKGMVLVGNGVLAENIRTKQQEYFYNSDSEEV